MISAVFFFPQPFSSPFSGDAVRFRRDKRSGFPKPGAATGSDPSGSSGASVGGTGGDPDGKDSAGPTSRGRPRPRPEASRRRNGRSSRKLQQNRPAGAGARAGAPGRGGRAGARRIVHLCQRAPTGSNTPVGGEVGIDTSEVSGDPEATIQKAQQIRAARQRSGRSFGPGPGRRRAGIVDGASREARTRHPAARGTAGAEPAPARSRQSRAAGPVVCVAR